MINYGRINSIDIFRYVCAIMVVAIHTHPFEDLDINLGYFFTQVFTRIAVPFFFAVSGFAYAQKIERKREREKERKREREKENDSVVHNWWRLISKYFYVYLIWSIIYLPLNIYFFLKSGNRNIVNFIFNLLKNFFVTGSYFHFWFFPALIFAISLTYFLDNNEKIKKIIIPSSLILWGVGCLCYSYANLNFFVNENWFQSWFIIGFNPIPLFIFMGFPAFINGYWVWGKWKEKGEYFSKKRYILIYLSIFFLVLFFMEMFIVSYFNFKAKISLSIFLYPLLMNTLLVLLAYPLTKFALIAPVCRYLANFTYYSHPLFICIISYFYKLFYYSQIPQTINFFTVCLLTMLSGLLLYYLKHEYNKKSISLENRLRIK